MKKDTTKINAAQASLGITRARDLASRCEVETRTAERWRAGDAEVPRLVFTHLALVADIKAAFPEWWANWDARRKKQCARELMEEMSK